MAEQRWTVPCQDAVGRPREVGIRRSNNGGTVLLLPAGESAELTAESSNVLIAVVRYALASLPPETDR